jgi:hypothetical protein
MIRLMTRFDKHMDDAFADIHVHRALRAPGSLRVKTRHACSFDSSSGRCGEYQADCCIGKHAGTGVSAQIARQYFQRRHSASFSPETDRRIGR